GYAWVQHTLITEAVLVSQPELENEKVLVTSFVQLLKDLSYPSALKFNTSIQIHKGYQFEMELNEVPGTEVSLTETLAHYSDEPDWGMDIELFAEDQYPELWRDEYTMMGGRNKGTPSQAFRHMYWPEYNFKHPMQSFKLPL